MSALRVALIADEDAEPLAAALRAAGHEATVLRPSGVPLADALLARRGFTGPLSHLPALVAALLRGRFDVVHAFAAPDAAAALAWRRLRGGRVVFTCREVLDRATVADRRLRRHALTAAVEDTDAVVAATAAARDALERWMAVDAPVLDPGDGPGHAALYARLVD